MKTSDVETGCLLPLAQSVVTGVLVGVLSGAFAQYAAWTIRYSFFCRLLLYFVRRLRIGGGRWNISACLLPMETRGR